MDKKLLIVSDLDGTLLGGELLNHDIFSISEFNKKAIKAISDAGHIFCIATGRAWSETGDIYDSAEIDTIIANSNGAFIHNPKDDNFKPIYSLISKTNANEILNDEFMKDNIIAYVAPSLTEVTYFNMNEELKEKMIYKNLTEHESNNGLIHHESTSIVIAVDTNMDFEKLDKVISKYKDISYYNWGTVFNKKYQFIELNTTVHKGFAVQEIAKHYGIDQENVITFGDQMNDIQMTKWASKGFAMKNANDGLKIAADEVLDKTNNEDGVGHKLMEILEGNI